MVDAARPEPPSLQVSGTEASDSPGFFHPSRRPYRFTILTFISLIVMGSYFAYDSIGALAPTLIEDLHLSRSTIGNLYTAYSVAAIAIVVNPSKTTGRAPIMGMLAYLVQLTGGTQRPAADTSAGTVPVAIAPGTSSAVQNIGPTIQQGAAAINQP